MARARSAFAQTVAQIEKAKNIAWKQTRYAYHPHKEGKGTWVKTEEEHAYKAPGLYQRVTTTLDEKEKDQERFVEITDRISQKELKLWPKRKKACPH